MNEKSRVSSWTKQAAEKLKTAGIPSASLDAELILAETIRKDRTYLHAHPEEELDPRRLDIAEARLNLRLDRVPIAYILGHKEFYGRTFKVSPNVLVPRPESETIIDLLKTLPVKGKLIDVGTGSGCLGITAKLELPRLDVFVSDISSDALNIARENAKKLGADIAAFMRSDLLKNIPGKFDVVVANLPYVDKAWQRSPETDHEPSLALFAEDGGLKLIFKLIDQLESSTTEDATILLEADPDQHEAIIAYAIKHRLACSKIEDYIVVLNK